MTLSRTRAEQLGELIDQLGNVPDIAVLMTWMNGDELMID
jgi:hypothetical protein